MSTNIPARLRFVVRYNTVNEEVLRLYEEMPLYLTCYDSEFTDSQVKPAKIQCLLNNRADIDLENDDANARSPSSTLARTHL
ncbi:hypothetical protein TSAR_011925 [Trichomalopsis sarcophagae]|uniref:Uncharacterized protein n=1 Tax=Trichomalopsis sarcophagae TaxID=543379 RepID=A0A232EMP7_9HYME|nr:hypothetical protein TSAR_011925 [Trichomalopsis sarcophagae]